MALESQLQLHVIREGLVALDVLVTAIVRLWEVRPPPLQGSVGVIGTHEEIPGLLVTICSSAATAYQVLFDKGTRRSSESPAMYNARLARVSLVEQQCGTLQIVELRNLQVRRRIVHIDEHLTKALLTDPDSAFLINLAVSNRDLIAPEEGATLLHCRVYFSAEDLILHLGAELHVGRLHAEATAVLDAFKNPSPEAPVGVHPAPHG